MSLPSTSSSLPPHNTKQGQSVHFCSIVYTLLLISSSTKLHVLICGFFVYTEDSDEDLFTVPDVESGPSSSAGKQQLEAELQQQSTSSGHGEGPPKNRKGRNPADREYRRLKRYN